MAKYMPNLSPLHTLLALLLASLTVVVPMGHISMSIPWLVVVIVAWKREKRRGRGGSAIATYVIVMTIVIVAAILAPVKTTERVLDRPIVLPRNELTLTEMDRETNFESADQWLPRYVSIRSTPENAAQIIHFRETNITLREFVETIEKQSDLTHRFSHCGNGSSILFGGDCCFGLRLR